MDATNRTPGKCLTVVATDKEWRNYIVPILKYSFDIDMDGKATLANVQSDIDLVDTYYGEDASRSSIRRPSQLFDFKPGTDIVVIAEAHPPADRGATQVDVMLQVGPIHKIVRAYGFRVWRKSAFGGVVPGPSMPIRAPVPLIYELAWGGQDLSDPAHPVGEPQNFVGRGISTNQDSLVDTPAAQLEDPDNPIGSRTVRPAALGAIHRHWQPRVSYAGTYDQVWMDTRMPLLPSDFHPRFHVCVPDDQWSATPLNSDVPIQVLNAAPSGIFSCQLPRIAPGFYSIVQGQRQHHATHLDTILVNAVERRVELTWRAAVPMPLKLEMINRIEVFEKAVI
jgi:hypothetical protein